MAWVNEPPIPAPDTVEALKRRFVKQNRDLARQVSLHSTRVRVLENELAQLRSENLRLTETIVHLQSDNDGPSSRRRIRGVQTQLEEKLHELTSLIAELRPAPEPKTHSTLTVGWRRGFEQVTDGSDGRLPAISEGKLYPRRTLDAREVRHLADASAESPSIGSPPVAHFQEDEPVTHDAPSVSQEKEDAEEVLLPPNLETRRKRRDSSSRLIIRRVGVFNSPEEAEAAQEPSKSSMNTLPTRTGAKRKLAFRDEEGEAAAEFAYSRKASESDSEKSGKEIVDKVVGLKSSTVPRREISTVASSRTVERKALGDKTTNTDVVNSPRKTGAKTGNAIADQKLMSKLRLDAPPKETLKPDPLKPRTRKSRSTASNIVSVAGGEENDPPLDKVPPQQEAKAELPPKTPATIADLFAAPSTEDPARSNSTHGTPAPTELGGLESGRQARRARATVNYAEPSLAAKMRRPDAKLLDAVDAKGRPQSGIVVRKSAEKLEHGDEASNSVIKSIASTSSGAAARSRPVKHEDPGSPLSNKGSFPESRPIPTPALEPEVPQSESAETIAALVKASRSSIGPASRRRSSVFPPASSSADPSSLAARSRPREKERETETNRRGSSIYDFSSSSPPRSVLTSSASRPSSREDERHVVGRRHSTVAGLRGVENVGKTALKRVGDGSRAEDGTAEATAAARVEMRASRRRSMVL